MQLDAKTTWWLTFALMALQGLNSVAWTTLGVDPHIIAGISQAVGYATGLLLFAIHGSLPGVGPVQMPKSVIALAVAGTALLALLLPGTAYAQFSNVPPMVVENYVGGVLLPVAVIAFAFGAVIGGTFIAITYRYARRFRPTVSRRTQ